MTKISDVITYAAIESFTGGSLERYRNPLYGGMIYTKGVKFISDNGGGWLIDKIMANVCHNEKIIKKRDFQVWKLRVDLDKGTAKLGCEDGNYKKLLPIEEITMTDFPLSEIDFFFIGDTLMLPVEY